MRAELIEGDENRRKKEWNQHTLISRKHKTTYLLNFLAAFYNIMKRVKCHIFNFG